LKYDVKNRDQIHSLPKKVIDFFGQFFNISHGNDIKTSIKWSINKCSKNTC